MKLKHALWSTAALTHVSASGLLCASALYYHTYAVARLDVEVENITVALIPGLDTTRFSQERRGQEAASTVEQQLLRFRVLRVDELDAREASVPGIGAGETLVVTNPHVDEKLPFQVGDRLRIRIRLVLPEEQFDPDDSRAEWWFFPAGEQEDIFPPRDPFRGITVIE